MELFICNCRGEINIPEKLDFGNDVNIHVESFLCSEDGKAKVEGILKNDSEMVLAACSPRIMEKFFSDYGAEIVNIREHAHFVGHGWKKMKDLIQGAVEK